MQFKPSLIPRFNYDYTFIDLLYGIKSIFADNNDIDMKKLSEIFDDSTFFFTNSGRSSLYIILKALNLPKGSIVGVPLYSCSVVFDAIIKAGCIPSFIDIDINNYTLDVNDLKEKIEDMDALIVIHTFGRPADMDEINKIATDIPVIEDCAHSLLSEYKGKKTGALGLASFFSLDKYISAGGGGMIIINDKNIVFQENLQRQLDLLLDSSSLIEIIHSIFSYVYSFLYHKPYFGGFAYPIGCHLDKKINISGNIGFSATKIKKSSLKIFIKKLDIFKEKILLQRKNSMNLINELQNTDLILPNESKGTWCNYYLFPILFSSKSKRDNAYEYLRNMGVDAAKLYNNTPSIARQFYGYKGNCPNTEEFVDKVLTIPNYYSLSTKELILIMRTVKKMGDLI